MNKSSITRLNRPVRLVPAGEQVAEPGVSSAGTKRQSSTGFAVTSAAYREFVRAARLRPYVAGELRRWYAGSDLITVGAAIRTAFADAVLPDDITQAIAAGYARMGGDGTAVTVRSIGPSGVPYRELFQHLMTTHDVLAACKRCFAAPFTDWAISEREEHGHDQLDVAVSIGIERETAAAPAAPSIDASTSADPVGYVVDHSDLLRLATWAVAAERNALRRQR
jgi:hypothetical protein